ncbi:MAG TPA: PilZ domain-containing protein, partial [Tepidisphaeraceae bacterium]|nr:PilZ domain-containing protein [Tepidisphaeraceae bacterium]
PELLKEFVTTLAPADRDERRAQRVKLRTHVTLLVRGTDAAGDVQAVNVQVKDLSPGGIGILRSQRMNLDEPFIVQLPRPDGSGVPMLCAVAYWEPLAENLYGVGARFIRSLHPDELANPKLTLARAAATLFQLDCFADDLPRRATA